jgi:myo-inositol 2-dehydrogenase/D-chiro-inositol 1-dehydrogenase
MGPAPEGILAVGVIGTGSIGTDHARRLSRAISGARVQAVFDVDEERAGALAEEIGVPARRDASEVIDDPGTDAVLVASADESHAEMVLACIAAGKPVLCEKPLAPTEEECRIVIAAEVTSAKHLVQVGFMRRYDIGFASLKKVIDDGTIGDVLVVHCVHRNASSPPGFTSSMSFTSSVIHEIDTARWLLGEELVAVTVAGARQSPRAPSGLRDPQLARLEGASGAVVDVEVFVNCQYGYDVRCEVVGSDGSAALDDPASSTTTLAGLRRQEIAPDWRDRFAPAYHTELQRWVDDIRAGGPSGPSAWDGYAATAAAECAVRSLETGRRIPIELDDRPAFYVPA